MIVDIERELTQHHISTLRAIDTGRVGLAIRRLEAYVKFAQAFLDAASKRGITFNFDASRSVSMMDWRMPIMIIENANDGIIAALRTGNRELILAATVIPLQFMKMSVEKTDFLFYRKISQVYPRMLYVSYSAELKSEKEIIVERSWKRLKEFAQYYLPKLTATHEDDIRKQFSFLLMQRFESLMKVAMDHNDTATFAQIGKELDSLFHDLEIFGLTADSVSSLENYATKEKLNIWFGFGAWLLRSFVSRDIQLEPGSPNPKLVDSAKISTFFEIVSRKFKNIKQLSTTYLGALAREHGSSEWHSWLMDTLPQGQAHFIGYDRWLTYFYVVMGLRLSKVGNLDIYDIPEPARDLEYRMNDIREYVKQIKANQQNWAVLIPRLASQSTTENTDETYWNYLLSANEAAVTEWTRLREEEIITSPIDPERVKRIQEEFINGWNDSAWLVKVFTSLGNKIERQADMGSEYFCVDELIPKEAFIEKSDTHYVGIGHDQGTTLGRTISQELFALLESKALSVVNVNPDLLLQKISEIVTSRSASKGSLTIFVSGKLSLHTLLLNTPGFIPRWRLTNSKFEFHEYLGSMNDIPVFFINNQQSSYALVVDLSTIGKLIHYLPEENNVGGLLVRVTGIDKDKANSIIDGQPAFLQGENGVTLTRDAAIRNLLLKVRIFVGVKIELEIENTNVIKKLTII
jgi:hypothetical protein